MFGCWSSTPIVEALMWIRVKRLRIRLYLADASYLCAVRLELRPNQKRVFSTVLDLVFGGTRRPHRLCRGIICRLRKLNKWLQCFIIFDNSNDGKRKGNLHCWEWMESDWDGQQSGTLLERFLEMVLHTSPSTIWKIVHYDNGKLVSLQYDDEMTYHMQGKVEELVLRHTNIAKDRQR